MRHHSAAINLTIFAWNFHFLDQTNNCLNNLSSTRILSLIFLLTARAEVVVTSRDLNEVISIIWTEFRNVILIAQSFYYPSFTDLVFNNSGSFQAISSKLIIYIDCSHHLAQCSLCSCSQNCSHGTSYHGIKSYAVHYTSANLFTSIFISFKVWMKNLTVLKWLLCEAFKLPSY